MQPENSFDKLSKRLATAVSRRSLLSSLSLAVSSAFLPWREAFAQDKNLTSADVETTFFAAPVVMEIPVAIQGTAICIVPILLKNSDQLAVLTTAATKQMECPREIESYFTEFDHETRSVKQAAYDKSRRFDARTVDGRSRLFKTKPMATSYSFQNPVTGKQEIEAYCSAFTYLDPRVHKGDSDRKIILYKRMPTPEKLTSLDDEVTCGDINYAYENEIKTRKPIALRDFTVDAVPHDSLSTRDNNSRSPSSSDSSHKSK